MKDLRETLREGDLGLRKNKIKIVTHWQIFLENDKKYDGKLLNRNCDPEYFFNDELYVQ